MKLNNAIAISLLAHAGLIVLLVTNYQFSKVEVRRASAPAKQINARAVDSKRVEQLVETLRQQRVQKVKDEQKRIDDLKQAEADAKKKRQEEERKADDARKRKEKAEQQRKDEEKKAAALKKKREQEEIERKKKAEAENKRKAEAERKRKEKEEAERKRKAKEEAERKRKEAEEKARQEALEKEMQTEMAAEAAALAAAHQQYVLSEADKYISLIRNRIERNWFTPETPGECTFRIRTSSGGLVLDIQTLGGDQAYCDSGRRAIRRAEPLPMPQDADVFNQLKILTFKLEPNNDDESL